MEVKVIVIMTIDLQWLLLDFRPRMIVCFRCDSLEEPRPKIDHISFSPECLSFIDASAFEMELRRLEHRLLRLPSPAVTESTRLARVGDDIRYVFEMDEADFSCFSIL